MRTARVRRLEPTKHRPAAEQPFAGCVVGRVVEVTDRGEPIVAFPGSVPEGLRARTVLAPGERTAPGTVVLLAFENGERSLPIILGAPRDRIDEAPTRTSVSTGEELVLNLRTLVVEAHREIVLRCGDGSLTIRADGTIVVRGTNLLSRSSGANRIKGGAVRIN
jgi:hypothetical protein